MSSVTPRTNKKPQAVSDWTNSECDTKKVHPAFFFLPLSERFPQMYMFNKSSSFGFTFHVACQFSAVPAALDFPEALDESCQVKIQFE